MTFSKFDWNMHPARTALTGAAAAVATVMFNRSSMDGTGIYGSQEQIAAEVGVSRRTVIRATAKLTELGLVEQVSRGSGYTGKSSEYRLMMPADKPAGQSNSDIVSSQVTSCVTSTDVTYGQDTSSDVTYEADSPYVTNRRSDHMRHPVSAGHSNSDTGVTPIDPLRESPKEIPVEEHEDIGGTSEMSTLAAEEKEEILAELRISEDDSFESQLEEPAASGESAEDDSWIHQLEEEHNRQPEEAASWWDTAGVPTTNQGEQMNNDPFSQQPATDPTPFGSVPQPAPKPVAPATAKPGTPVIEDGHVVGVYGTRDGGPAWAD